MWKYLFDMKRTCKFYDTGGVQVSVKNEVTSFNLEKKDSVQGCRKKWFYLKDQTTIGQQYGLAPFDPVARAKRTRAWKHELTDAELAEVGPLYRRVVELKRTPG